MLAFLASLEHGAARLGVLGGFKVWGSGFRVWGLGFRGWGLGFAWGLGSRLLGSEGSSDFRSEGSLEFKALRASGVLGFLLGLGFMGSRV